MKKNIILSVFLSLFLTSVKGNDAPQLYADFIKESVLDFDEDIREIWKGVEINQPPGGYLFRFYFDVTGDGVDELFLSSSLNSDRRSTSWDVFKKDQQGNFKRVTKKIDFHPEVFYFKQTQDGGVITQIFGRLRDGGFRVYTYKFFRSGEFTNSWVDKKVEETELATFDEGKWLESLDLGQLVTNQNIEKILLGQFCRNPNVKWQQYDRKHSIPQQYLDPADAEDIKSVENFTPEEAKKLIEQWKQKEATTNSPPKTSSAPSNQTQTNRVSQTTLETKSSKQIIIWSIIGILGLGLVTIFILKKRT